MVGRLTGSTMLAPPSNTTNVGKPAGPVMSATAAAPTPSMMSAAAWSDTAWRACAATCCGEPALSRTVTTTWWLAPPYLMPPFALSWPAASSAPLRSKRAIHGEVDTGADTTNSTSEPDLVDEEHPAPRTAVPSTPAATTVRVTRWRTVVSFTSRRGLQDRREPPPGRRGSRPEYPRPARDPRRGRSPGRRYGRRG